MDKKIIALIAGGVLVIVFVGAFLFSQSPKNAFTPASITIWGTLPKESMQEVIREYTKVYQESRIAYVEKPAKDFESSLINALASGSGPDAWIADQELLTTHADKIRNFPSTFYAASTLKSEMVDLSYQLYAVRKAELPTSEVRALPLWVDPLVLFWNRDLFNAASIATAPATWEDFADTSTRLIRRDAQANISTSGAAFGRGGNVPEAYDIVTLLLLQRGGNMFNESGRVEFGNPADRASQGTSLTEDVVRYYTDFGNIGRSTYSWSASFTNPFDRFTAGRAGMMVNYLSRMSDITVANPHLRVNIAPVPQANDTPLTLAHIPAYAVAMQSKNATQAWHFGTYLAGDGASLVGIPKGTAPARRALIASKTDPDYKDLLTSAALQSAWPRDTIPHITRDILSATLDAIANTKLTVSEGVAQANAQLERARNNAK